MVKRWDIFCTVVDNYGDIGVTWRLARQLVAEHGVAVRLWVDDLQAFAKLCPEAEVKSASQLQAGVEICHWSSDWQATVVADVVIEAFGCALPAQYLTDMQVATQKPLWLNLEYLSAEDWVGGCHALPSLQPSGLRKFFFFPGFRQNTGGLLREQGLLQRRMAFQQDAGARNAFLNRLGVQPTTGEQLYSLFSYECASLPGWLQALAENSQPILLLVPEGRVLAGVQVWLGADALAAPVKRGQLRVQVLPFLAQDDYDRLLWSCDFNAVRGEDSFVRALWAGRPLLWHIYQQSDAVHLHKLQAFLELYLQGLSPPAAQALGNFCSSWNQGQETAASWVAVREHWPELLEHAQQWSIRQAAQPDLAAGLAHFCANWL